MRWPPSVGSPAVCVESGIVRASAVCNGAADAASLRDARPPSAPGCCAEQVVLTDPATVEIAAHGTRTGTRCPGCGQSSTSPHGGYVRRPADLPSVGRRVRLAIWVRRFRCGNLAVARPLVGPSPRCCTRFGWYLGQMVIAARTRPRCGCWWGALRSPATPRRGCIPVRGIDE